MQLRFNSVYISSTINAEHNQKIQDIFTNLTHGANLEKLHGFLQLYSVRGSQSLRYLCIPYNGTFAVIGVLENHNYEDCQKFYNAFQNNYEKDKSCLTEFKFDEEVTCKGLVTAPNAPISTDGELQTSKVIFLSANQDEVLTALSETKSTVHSFVNGIAGTGKTTIAQYLLQDFNDRSNKVLYLCPSESLADSQRQQYETMIAENNSDAQPEVHFKSIREFYQAIGLLADNDKVEDKSCFDTWHSAIINNRSHPLNNTLKTFKGEQKAHLYSEFKSMLSMKLGNAENETNDKARYQELPIDLSLFPKESRDDVFKLFKSYLNFLKEQKIKCLDLIGPELLQDKDSIIENNRYTQVLIDEVQIFPSSTIQIAAKLSTNKLAMFGDYNQGKFNFRHDELQKQLDGDFQVLNLNWNFRCSEPVVNLANFVLRMQRAFIGGDFSKQSIKDLIHKRQDDPENARVSLIPLEKGSNLSVNNQTVFIVKDEATRDELIAKYQGQIFTVLLADQISGLEFDDVVLYKFINEDYEKIAKSLAENADFNQSDKIHQPKDKEEAAKNLNQIEKFRRLFLAVTRAKNSIRMVENSKSAIVKLLRENNIISHPDSAESSAIDTVATSPDSTSINYDIIVQLLNNEKSFDEGIRQIKAYLVLAKSTLSNDITNAIESLSKQRPKFNFNKDFIQKILEITSKDQLDLLVKNSPKSKKSAPTKVATSNTIDKADAKVKTTSLMEHCQILLKYLNIPQATKPLPFYAALADSGLKIGSTEYRTVQAIKNSIYNSLSSPKKGKGSSSQGQKLLAGTQINEKNYKDGKVTIDDSKRAAELEVIAKHFNIAIIVLDGTTTAKNPIQYYNPTAKNIIILRQDSLSQYVRFTVADDDRLALIKEAVKRAIDSSAEVSIALLYCLKYNLSIVKAAADGHCLYHSIMASKPSYDGAPVKDYQELRNLAANEIEASPNLSGKVEGTLEKYLSGVRGLSWGGELEISALSQKLNCPIVVFSNTLSNPLIHGQDLPNPPIFLHHNGNHYDSIKPNGDKWDLLFSLLDGGFLLKALSKNNFTPVTNLLKKCVNVNAVNRDGNTPLMFAIACNDDASIESLLARGANVNTISNKGETALMAAAMSGKINLVRKLLERGADVNATNHCSETALSFATEYNHTDVINLLFPLTKTNGSVRITQPPMPAHVNSPDKTKARAASHAKPTGTKPTHSTIQTKSSASAPVNAAIVKGDTVLMSAARNGKYKFVEPLLKAGADVTAMNHKGETALSLAKDPKVKSLLQEKIDYQLRIAARDNDAKKVEQLLAIGAKVDGATSEGITALMFATQNGHHDVVKLLLSNGTKVDAADPKGLTPLILAAELGHYNIVELLLAYGADVNAATCEGVTALMLAAQSGFDEVIKRLLAVKDINVNAAARNGLTALCSAAQNGHDRVVNQLLAHGADVNAADFNGYTPLMRATYNRHYHVVKSLLEKGADANATDIKGYTALMIAVQNRDIELITLLSEYTTNAHHDGKERQQNPRSSLRPR